MTNQPETQNQEQPSPEPPVHNKSFWNKLKFGNEVQDSQRFSKAQATLAILLVAAVGGLVIYRTLAAPGHKKPPKPPGGSTGAATFPSRLKTSGRQLVDENGHVMPVLKGFNVQVGPDFTWSQANFTAMAGQGAKIVRMVIFWSDIEPTKGVINPTEAANLDTQIAEAQAAGLYTELEIHLNAGRDPSWTTATPYEMERYSTYGQTVTQYLANRYGNPASPKYTKAVVGFGLNEPPLENNTIRNGNGSIPYLEGKQRQMLTWVRAAGFAPSWIGFVAFGYASATPIYDHTYQNPAAINADPHAYDGVGGNVVIDFHDYMIGITGPTSTNPNIDGRQWNGMDFPVYQGGTQLSPSSTPSPTYTSTATHHSQLTAYAKPYKTFTTTANIPLMIGEWGWVPTAGGEIPWITDQQAVWKDAGAIIEMYWDYDVTTDTAKNAWASTPGGVWRPSITNWMATP